MDLLLWLFLLLAMAAIIYSIRLYQHSPSHHFKKAMSNKTFYMIVSSPNREEVNITNKGLSFIGTLEIGNDEMAFKVTKIFIQLKEPHQALQGWSRDDFYKMEREIYIQYPDADIGWEEPIDSFLNNLDMPTFNNHNDIN